MKLAISQIIVKDRIRKDVGDVISLEKSIHKFGLFHPVVVSKQYELIAGQRRLLACKNLEWTEINVNIIDLEKLHDGEIDENQIRKDFTSSEILEIAKYVEPAIREENKENQGERNDLKEPCEESSQSRTPKKTREAVADATGISHDSLKKLKEIEEESKTNPKYVKLLVNIDNKQSRDTINSVFKKLQKLKKSRERVVTIKETQVVLPDSITLYNQDFQTAPIQDNSISLILTDPLYHKEHLHLYSELGKQAFRILKEGGSLITYCGHFNIDDVIREVKKSGLKYQWIFAIIHSGPTTRIHSNKVHVGWKPMLWFTKGKYDGAELSDVIQSKYEGKELHEYEQSTKESDYFIQQMTIENEIVYDPFMGSGTFGVSAKKLKRQFIGCEIDTEHYQNARSKISNE